MARRTYRNPWAQELVENERAYFARNEREMGGAYNEADYAEAKPVRVCPMCGADAFFKPTVGTCICPECGSLETRHSGWVKA